MLITTKNVIGSKEDVYKHFSQLEVYNAFSEWPLEIKKLTNSPLRKDNNPSFILLDGEPTIYYDFTTGDSGDVVDFVMKKMNINYYQALRLIAERFKLDKKQYIKEITRHKSNSKSKIKVWYRKWDKRDIEFWTSFHISKKTLSILQVYPIIRCMINSNIFECDDITYCYHVGSRLKIYRPTVPKFKFSGNTNQNSIFGYATMRDDTDELIITSSLKEVAVLIELGYNAIAPNSESTLFKKEIMDYLKSRYSKIYVLFDWDSPGKALSERFCEYYGSLINIEIEADEKDLSDYSKKYGLVKTNKIIKNAKNRLDRGKP